MKVCRDSHCSLDVLQLHSQEVPGFLQLGHQQLFQPRHALHPELHIPQICFTGQGHHHFFSHCYHLDRGPALQVEVVAQAGDPDSGF
eukprot:10538209-Lingulodinium_polyedra.AAC.1